MNIWYEGHLEHPKKCSGMHFWGLETCSNTKFLKSKKKIFRKFGGKKKCKITFLGCGTKKRFRVKILIDYIYPIDEIWAYLEYGNILEKSILRLSCTFGAFFLGVERRKSLVGSMLELCHKPKNVPKKNFRYLSIFQNFQLRCATKTRWDILKNFWPFFLSPHGRNL